MVKINAKKLEEHNEYYIECVDRAHKIVGTWFHRKRLDMTKRDVMPLLAAVFMQTSKHEHFLGDILEAEAPKTDKKKVLRVAKEVGEIYDEEKGKPNDREVPGPDKDAKKPDPGNTELPEGNATGKPQQ